MENHQKETLKIVILEKIDVLEQDIQTFKKISKPVSPDNAIGRITRMEAIGSKSINEASLENLKQTLRALEQTLAHIDDADFGSCHHCEEPIPFKRLLIMPETQFCVDCSDKFTAS